MPRLLINARTLTAELTGVQRYASELVARLPAELEGWAVERAAPERPLDGVRGHAWEQFALPGRTRGALLWSPGNTGPLAVRRQVVTIHDAATLDHPEWFDRRFAAWYGWLLPRLGRGARAVLTVSEFSRRRLIAHGIPEERISVVPPAADARFRPIPPDETAALRARLDLPERYVLCVASLEPRKNLGGLFRAWSAASLPEDVRLVVAGGAGKVFRDLGFEEAPRGVQLLGRVPDTDLPALYSGALAFAFPSLYEGFGLPPLEAMACGTPVVTAEAASLPEVVGNAAITADPHDVGGLARALERVVADEALRREMRVRGLLRARRFSWEEAARRTAAVLRAASGKDRP